MVKAIKNNKEKILEAINAGKIDKVEKGYENLIDEIILRMKRIGLTEIFNESIDDGRSSQNGQIPMEMLIVMSIAAKMKLKSALTDIPYAISDAELMLELGWNIEMGKRKMEDGAISDGAIRNYVRSYEEKREDYKTAFTEMYNKYVIKVKEKMDINPTIHILDCTEEEVNLSNSNYEKSGVIKDKDGVRRGYKMGTLRGVFGDRGLIEEMAMGPIERNDLKVCEGMLRGSVHLKPGDVVINDRGFISREMVNHLKGERGVDVYVPAKSNMIIYKEAVKKAIEVGKWEKHPNAKRASQRIAFVGQMGEKWQGEEPEKDVGINVCVVRDTEAKDREYYVFMTTDTKATGKQIVKTYEIRPEIEEDYRQLKDFWGLEEFYSTKYLDITFHNVMVLIGYLYFQIYVELDEGAAYAGRSLPVILKNWVPVRKASFVVYANGFFAVFGFLEIMLLYSSLDPHIQLLLQSHFVFV